MTTKIGETTLHPTTHGVLLYTDSGKEVEVKVEEVELFCRYFQNMKKRYERKD